MSASLIRKTSVIWWMLVLSGMAMSCSSPVREAGRAAVTVQEPVTLPLTRESERVSPVPYPSATDPQDESVAADNSEEDAIWSYLGHIFQKLESHKRYPSIMALSGLNGRVVLRFTVRRDGEIIDPQITEVTGHESFGNAALQALRRVGQLPPFPDEIRRHELLVEVPMTYRLSVSEDDVEDAGPSEEIWRCFALSDRNKDAPLLILFRSTSGNEAVDLIGMVFVAGTAHAAQFRVAGLDRRWDFDYNEGRGAFRYAFVIEPDGTGAYYDFSTSDDGTAKAKQIFRCQPWRGEFGTS